MKPQRELIKELLLAISRGLYERDESIALALLSAVAGESIFLLGMPGVGKSMVGRRLKMAFSEARSFDYLMSRFSTPDEIFGPVSISKLKDENSYERVVEGYLPTADIVFLDEIWKAGPSIQNALLTVLNEKIFRNGQRELQLPLKGIIAASNELPAVGEGLEALWDRFLIRLIVDEIEDEHAFNSMITSTSDTAITIDKKLQITAEQYGAWQVQINEIVVTPPILEVISAIRQSIAQLNIKNHQSGDAPAIFVSDRRWKKIVRLLRTSAFINGRDEVEISDMTLVENCLWNTAPQRSPLQTIARTAMVGHLLSRWQEQLSEIERRAAELQEELRKSYGEGFLLYPGGCYKIKSYNDGDTYIHKALYDSLSPRNAQDMVIKPSDSAGASFNVQSPSRLSEEQRVPITKSDNGVKINGRDYRIEFKTDNAQINDLFHRQKVESLAKQMTELHGQYKKFLADTKRQFAENLFAFDFAAIVAELTRFELAIRKSLRTLQL